MGVHNVSMVQPDQHFGGIHWETGTLRNALAHLGITNPHTGQPFSEAMLLGIGGGIVLLYAVEVRDDGARVMLGTRAPVEMIETICQRLGIETRDHEFNHPARATAALQLALHESNLAIVWADRARLPYNTLPASRDSAMLPLLVYHYNERADEFHLADRARVPLIVSCEALAAARARQHNQRMLILAPPDAISEKTLKQAVLAGIRDCVRFSQGKAPKGVKAAIGLPAFLKWGEALVDRRGKRSWIQLFAPGKDMLTALTDVYQQIELNGTGGSASRRMYAEFLEEAFQLLQRPNLKSAAGLFRISADLWDELAETVLPQDEKAFRELRDLLRRRHSLFIEHGAESMGEMQVFTAQLGMIEAEIHRNFPMSDQKAATLRGMLRDKIHQIYEVEEDAVQAMQRALDEG